MSLVVAHLAPGVRARSVRTGLFLFAILLVNYTLGRPSPVDIAFAAALLTTALCHQSITPAGLAYFSLAIIWAFGLYVSSSPHMHDPDVQYQVVKISYAVSISFTACLTAIHWRARQVRMFVNVWIVSACIAAALGVFGFATGDELFTWDGRAKGLLDDPNMYGAFLLPGVMGAVYFTFTARRRWPYALALAWLSLGMMLSFSRVALAACFVLGLGLAFYLNRRRPLKFIGYLLTMALVAVVIGLAALVVLDTFGDKLADRLTFAKDYDSGQYGRLNRYFIALEMIFLHPVGLGAAQFEKTYPEPIHNILLSSFMNYGWGSGFAWAAIMLFSVVLSVRNYRRTKDELFIVLLLCWMGVMACAMLHEAERWRHMWLMTGLVWGLNARNWASAPVCEPPRPAARVVRYAAPQPPFGLGAQRR